MEDKNVIQNLKTNLINWYDFKSTDSIWVLGNVDNEIIDFLRSKFKSIEVSENPTNTNFDCILAINYFDEQKSDKEIKNEINEKAKFLNENGEILLIFRNRLGAKEIVNETFEGFSKSRILNLISDFKYKFYYMLPTMEYVNIIFTDDYLPTQIDIGRNLNFSYSSTNSGTLENDFLNSVLKNYNRDFENCANVYFVELSKQEITNETQAVFFSNIRNEEYSIRTKLLKNVAIKEAVNEKSVSHIQIIKKNIDILNKVGIKTLDTYEDNKIISKLALGSEKLDEKVLKYYKNGNNEYKSIIEKFKNDVLLKLEKTDKENNVFEKYGIIISDKLLNDMTFVKTGLWDLTFRNIIIIDDEYYAYDQEWYEENLPIEFILFRSILHLENTNELEKMDLLEKLDLKKYYEYFYKLEQWLGDEINNHKKLELYSKTLDKENEDIKFQKELTKCKELINSDLETKYKDALNNCNNLSNELNQKNIELNDLQMAISNSKTLKYTRNVKKVVKKTTSLCFKVFRKPVKFVCKKIVPKKVRRKLKTKIQYSNKLSKIAGIPTFYQYNHNMKLYDKIENQYTEVGSQLELNKTIGIHLHLYYEDLAEEFYRYLSNIPYVFDLYISIRKGVKPSKIKRIFKDITNLNYLEVKVSENCGRDFGPMFVLFADKLKNYDYIMHIHSKKTLRAGSEQVEWRQYLLNNLLGGPEIITKCFYMMENLNIGLVFPDTHWTLAYWLHAWLDEKGLASQILSRMNIELKDDILEFSAGSMFWAKKDALKQIFDLHLTWEDFGKDKQQVGGTLEYVFERIPGILTRHNGYNIAIYNDKKEVFYLNHGDKMLSQYYALTPKIVTDALLSFEVVTFDIFDTLITRKVFNPDDAFLLIQKNLKSINIELTDYKKIRKDAEFNVRRKKNFKGDCNIHEIYDEFKEITGLSKSKVEKIKQLEIETEMKLCVPRRDMISIFDELVSKNKKIILISDMYLTKDILEKILNKCGFFGWSELWVSSEMGYRKDNGTMWDYFLSQYADKNTIHVGDNEQTDIHALTDRGRVNLHLASSRREMQMSNYRIENTNFDLANSILFGCVYNNSLFSSPFALHDNEEKSIVKNCFDMGYSIIGPVILYYLLWLINSVKDNSKNEILLFAAREGYYLQKLYEHLKERLEIKELKDVEDYYLLISRRAITVAGIRNKEDIYALFKRKYNGTLREVLYYRLGFKELNFENRLIELPKDFEIVKEVIDNNYEIIMKQVEYERKNYLKYINTLSPNINNKTLNYVDLGYAGTAQYYLSKLLEKKVTGKYFVVSDEVIPQKIGCRVDSCFNDMYAPDFWEKPIYEVIIYRYVILLEGFLTAPQGQLKYIDENLKPHYTAEDNKEKQDKLNEIYWGVKALIDDMVDVYGEDLLDIKIDKEVIENNYKIFAKEAHKISPEMKKIFNVDDFYSSNGMINGINVLI